MKFRNSVFVVVYFKGKGKTEYLVLKRKLHWTGWEFPKGGVDSGETKLEAVKREVKEETGLKILKIKKLDVSGKFRYNKILRDRPKLIGQKFSLYSAEVKKAKVKIDEKEHSGYRWLKFEDAVKKLTWKNQQKCLKVVNNLLEDETKKSKIKNWN